MKYYINLFSPNTALAFSESDQEISGFRISRKAYVENQHINIGDKFICYCTKIQRFIGILEITSNFFIDSKLLGGRLSKLNDNLYLPKRMILSP